MSNRSRLQALAAPKLAAATFALLAAFALAAPAAAQTIRDKQITENPSRTPGGSCIYGGDGKLIHAPRGVACPEVEGGPPPASMAESPQPAQRAPAPARATAGRATPPAGGAASRATTSTSATAANTRTAAVAPEVSAGVPRGTGGQPTRAELAALLAERDRLDVELMRVREAVAYEDREAARQVVDQALAKIARHLENEARVLQGMVGRR